MSESRLDFAEFEISHDDLGGMIAQLEQSLYNHQQWYNALIRTLICKLPPDRHDLHAEAWKECRFGQWYYFEAFEKLKNHPSFKALGAEHKRMHILAKELLLDSQNSHAIAYSKYDSFANSLDRLRLEMAALKHDLEELLYNRDSLTGLLTRVNIIPILREYHEMAKQEVHSFCLVMMDFDNFKSINDTHGHAIGDKVLAAIAHFIVKNLRPYDKVFRYGGEEFLACLQDIELPKAFDLVDRLRENLKNFAVEISKGNSIQVTASFGISLLNPYATIEASIENADKALYLAKKNGRNQSTVWEESALK